MKLSKKEFLKTVGHQNVVNKFLQHHGTWKEFTEDAKKMAKYGLQGGIPNWIVSSDMVNFLKTPAFRMKVVEALMDWKYLNKWQVFEVLCNNDYALKPEDWDSYIHTSRKCDAVCSMASLLCWAFMEDLANAYVNLV